MIGKCYDERVSIMIANTQVFLFSFMSYICECRMCIFIRCVCGKFIFVGILCIWYVCSRCSFFMVCMSVFVGGLFGKSLYLL